jgi:hypothetical protein
MHNLKSKNTQLSKCHSNIIIKKTLRASRLFLIGASAYKLAKGNIIMNSNIDNLDKRSGYSIIPTYVLDQVRDCVNSLYVKAELGFREDKYKNADIDTVIQDLSRAISMI